MKREGHKVLTALTESCGGSVQAHSRLSKGTVVLRRQAAFCRCSRQPGKSIYCLASASGGVIICLFYRSHSRFVLRRGDENSFFSLQLSVLNNITENLLFSTQTQQCFDCAHTNTRSHTRALSRSKPFTRNV